MSRYLVKWKNTRGDCSTWENPDVLDTGLIESYQDKQQDKVAKRVKMDGTVKLGLKGSLQMGDKIYDLVPLDSKKFNNQGYKFQAQWYKRIDNTHPQPSVVYSEEIRKYDPQMLIDYYQKRVKFQFVDKQQEKLDRQNVIHFRYFQKKKEKEIVAKNEGHKNKELESSNKKNDDVREVISIKSNNSNLDNEHPVQKIDQNVNGEVQIIDSKNDDMDNNKIDDNVDDDNVDDDKVDDDKVDRNNWVEIQVESDESFNEKVMPLCIDNSVLVDFYTEWCPPCQRMKPILQQVCKEIDKDENVDTYEKFNIQKPPTVVMLKEGKEVKRFVGERDKTEIQKFINDNR